MTLNPDNFFLNGNEGDCTISDPEVLYKSNQSMQMEMNLYATIICMCPRGQLDGKQERLDGNTAEGLFK